MRPAQDGGSRFGIVLNGSPLFTGGAGSGESEIRRYVLENDLVEAIIGLPTDMFYNTGISTYVWIVSNRKPAHRKGKVQLIDASGFWQKMRKSLGSKRKELSDADRTYRLFDDSPSDCFEAGVACRAKVDAAGRQVKRAISRIFKNEDFGYRTITVERPLRDEQGKIVLGDEGQAEGQAAAGRRPARHRERAAGRGRGRLLQARGAAACARCLDRPREDEGRLRDPVQPALLCLQAAAPARRDRRRSEGGDRPHHDDDRGAGGMSFPRYESYKDSGVEWLGEVPGIGKSSSLGPLSSSQSVTAYWSRISIQTACRCFELMTWTKGRPTEERHDNQCCAVSAVLPDYRATRRRSALSRWNPGNAIKIEPDLEGVNLSRAVARLQPNGKVSADLMCWLFQSVPFRRYIDLVCVGTAQRVLNMAALSAYRMALPPPRNKQPSLPSLTARRPRSMLW